MNYKMKRAASASIARKVAAAAATFALATSSVPVMPIVAGLAPQVAMAEPEVIAINHQIKTTAAETGIQLIFNNQHVKQIELYFAEAANEAGTAYNYAKVTVIPSYDASGNKTIAVTYLDNAATSKPEDDINANKSSMTALTGKCKVDLANLLAFDVTATSIGKVETLTATYSQAGTGTPMRFSSANILAAYDKTSMADCTDSAVIDTDNTDALFNSTVTIDAGAGKASFYSLASLEEAEPVALTSTELAALKYSDFGKVVVEAPAGMKFDKWEATDTDDDVDAIKAHLDLESPSFMLDQLNEALPLATAGKLTLKATYVGNSYTLKLDAGAGTYGGPKSLSLTVGDASGKLVTAVPTLEKATFWGWGYTDPEGKAYLFKSLAADANGTTVYVDGVAQASSVKAWDIIDSLSTDGADLTLKAVYLLDSNKTVNAWMATFGAETDDSAKLASSAVLSGTAVELKNSGKGYFIDASATVGEKSEFAGWYAIPYSGSPITKENIAKGKLVTTNKTLFADQLADNFQVDNTNTEVATTFVAVFDKVAAKSFTISFDLGEATLKPDGKAITSRPATTESTWSEVVWANAAVTNNYTYTGRTFMGWALTEGATTPMTPAEQAEVIAAGEDVTLHAVWAVASDYYVIEAYATPENAGTVSSADVTTKADPFTTYNNVATANQGYTFDGWFLVTKDGSDDKLNPVVDAGGKAVTSETLTGAVAKATIKKVTGSDPAKGTGYKFCAKFHADKYSVIFGAGSTPITYTVGEDALLPVGATYTTSDGTVIESKAQLDAMVTKDGDVIQLNATPITSALPENDPDTTYAEKHPGYDHWVDFGDGSMENARWAVYKDGKLRKDCWVTYSAFREDGSWKNTSDWYYLDADGEMVVGKAKLKFGKTEEWYYMNPNHDGTYGRMYSGWLPVDGDWYYCDPVQGTGTFGKMFTGWKQIDGSWYYFYEDESDLANFGKMATNTTIGGCAIGADGRML